MHISNGLYFIRYKLQTFISTIEICLQLMEWNILKQNLFQFCFYLNLKSFFFLYLLLDEKSAFSAFLLSKQI